MIVIQLPLSTWIINQFKNFHNSLNLNIKPKELSISKSMKKYPNLG